MWSLLNDPCVLYLLGGILVFMYLFGTVYVSDTSFLVGRVIVQWLPEQ